MHAPLSFLSLFWNPSPNLFTVPFIDRPITYYALFFVGGFFLGYLLLLPKFKALAIKNNLKNPEEQAVLSGDRLLFYSIIGTVIGARLGHVFFYDWPYYQNHLSEIFKIWEGGLASHGGALGILLAFYLFFVKEKKNYHFTFIEMINLTVPSILLITVCIRIGNFFNQEILGYPTSFFTAVIFGNAMDGGSMIPRHPVPLYEAFTYALLFLAFSFLSKKKPPLKPQKFLGLFLIALFSARFALEFFKSPQSLVLNDSVINMGQWLSLPFILVGVYFLNKKNI